MEKLAQCYLTYNRPQNMQESLGMTVKSARQNGIEIYVYDGSENSETQKAAEQFKECGNVHYLKRQEGLLQRMIAALTETEAEYIWLCGDNFIISPSIYPQIMRQLEKGTDILVCYDSFVEEGIKSGSYDRPEAFLRDAAVPLTHIGSAVIKRELITEEIVRQYRQKMDAGNLVFPHIFVYLRAICKDEFNGYFLFQKENFRIESKLNTGHGVREKHLMWDCFMRNWYQVVMELPGVYEPEKKYVLGTVDTLAHFFCFHALLRQRSFGEFDIAKTKKYKVYVKSVVTIPFPAVCLIAAMPKGLAKKLADVISWKKRRVRKGK